MFVRSEYQCCKNLKYRIQRCRGHCTSDGENLAQTKCQIPRSPLEPGHSGHGRLDTTHQYTFATLPSDKEFVSELSLLLHCKYLFSWWLALVIFQFWMCFIIIKGFRLLYSLFYLNIYFEQMGLCRFIFYVEIECTNVYLHYINQPLAWKYFWISFEEGKLWCQVDLFIQFHQYYLWCVWQQNEIKLQYCDNRGLIYGDPININYESLSATKVVRVQLILITCRIVVCEADL